MEVLEVKLRSCCVESIFTDHTSSTSPRSSSCTAKHFGRRWRRIAFSAMRLQAGSIRGHVVMLAASCARCHRGSACALTALSVCFQGLPAGSKGAVPAVLLLWCVRRGRQPSLRPALCCGHHSRDPGLVSFPVCAVTPLHLAFPRLLL